ncbi:MAG: YwaF family protein [Clostridia bacterium]|nr:YwaF family protein [Clostridia bacterium]
MGAEFTQIPPAFGAVHIAILAAVAAACTALWFVFKRTSDKKLIRLLFILGASMILAEAWKQWFTVKYVFGGTYSAWFFPWQLCSMAMYCSAAVPFLRGRARETALVFLASFTLIAAAAALVFPGDMLRPQIMLFCHSFLYHGVMAVESIAAMRLLMRGKKPAFLPAAGLFLAMAAVAEAINVAFHALLGDISREPNMFNITPYYPTTQPVFHEIAVKLGVIPEIIIYLAVIILVSFGVYAAVCAGVRRNSKRSGA